MNRKLTFLFLFSILTFSACSSYPEVDDDILAQHIYSQNPIVLSSSDKDYVSMLAKSFGMTEKDVLKLQKHILSKKTTEKMKEDFNTAFQKKIFELKQRKNNAARKDFIVNVLAPYLSMLSRNEGAAYDTDVCKIYHFFFTEPYGKNSLCSVISEARAYFNGEKFNSDKINNLNLNLMHYGLFVDLELQNSANVLQIQDTLLPLTAYKNDSVGIIKLKRFIPSLMPPKKGYYTIGFNYVVILSDMVNASAENDLLELEKGDLFEKYTDERFEYFWEHIGLNLNLNKANDIYRKLLRKDFEGKKLAYIQRAEELIVALHEAKHIVDQIEHPELNLNLDAEFTAHVTSSIFSATPNFALYSAIERMEKYAMYQRQPYLNDVVFKLWNMAEHSAFDNQYNNDSLRIDLTNLYNNYRTIRENAYFEPLDDFFDKIAKNL